MRILFDAMRNSSPCVAWVKLWYLDRSHLNYACLENATKILYVDLRATVNFVVMYDARSQTDRRDQRPLSAWNKIQTSRVLLLSSRFCLM